MTDTYAICEAAIEKITAIDGDAPDLFEQVTDVLVSSSDDPKVRGQVFYDLDSLPGRYDDGYTQHDWHWKLRRTRNGFGPLFDRLQDGRLSAACVNKTVGCTPDDPCDSCCLDAQEARANELPSLDEIIEALAAIHPELPAAIGHAMCFAVEDGSRAEDQLLVDPRLAEAAGLFYDEAREMAERWPNILPD